MACLCTFVLPDIMLVVVRFPIRDRTGIIDQTDNYRPIDLSVVSMVVSNILFDGVFHLLEAFSNGIAFKRILG